MLLCLPFLLFCFRFLFVGALLAVAEEAVLDSLSFSNNKEKHRPKDPELLLPSQFVIVGTHPGKQIGLIINVPCSVAAVMAFFPLIGRLSFVTKLLLQKASTDALRERKAYSVFIKEQQTIP